MRDNVIEDDDKHITGFEAEMFIYKITIKK